MLLFLFQACLVSSELSCPMFLCDNWATDTCLYSYDNIKVYTPCTAPDTYCPDFTFDFEKDHINCEPGQGEGRYKKKCKASVSLNKNCNGRVCKPGLFCNSQNKCSSSPGLNEACTTNCSIGLNCNFQKCIKNFILKPGDSSSNALGCISGRMQNNLCLPTDKSLSLPQFCESNADCLGTDNIMTQCKCTREEVPKKICTLHESDPQILDLLEAEGNGDTYLAKLLKFQTDNYPMLQYSAVCHIQDSVELKTEKALKYEYARCWASVIMFNLGLIFSL